MAMISGSRAPILRPARLCTVWQSPFSDLRMSGGRCLPRLSRGGEASCRGGMPRVGPRPRRSGVKATPGRQHEGRSHPIEGPLSRKPKAPGWRWKSVREQTRSSWKTLVPKPSKKSAGIAGSDHGPAITEIDSAHLRGGNCLIVGPTWSSPRVLPITSRHGNRKRIDVGISWENGHRTGYSWGF